MTKRSRSPKKPHARAKAAKRELSPDELWAEDLGDRVLTDCHPFQRPAVETLLRFITLLIGRGGGKTTTMRARAIRKMARIRKARIVYIAPTRLMAKELNWDKLKDSIEFYGEMDNFEFHESDLRCTCKKTGAFYKLVGMDDQGEVDKLRGQPFDEVQPDEASLYKPELLDNLLRKSVGPRLGERRGTICMGSTPGHNLRGPFYDYTRPGAVVEDPDDPENKIPLHVPFAELGAYPDWDGYVSFAWTLKDVAELPKAASLYPALVNLWEEALRTKKRERWSDTNPIWLREYLGLWAADDTDTVFKYRPHLDDGSPWNQWDPFDGAKLEGLQALQKAVAKLRAIHPELGEWHFVVIADKGSTDPFACNVFAFSPRDVERRIWHVMPFERTRMYTRPMAELLLGPDSVTRFLAGKPLDPLGGVFGVIGWPDGTVFDSDQWTIDDLANNFGIRFAKADRNPYSKMGAIELVNGDFVDGRIKIIKNSPLEVQLGQLQWAEDSHGRLVENKAQANHSTDTLIYGRRDIQRLWDSGVVAQERPGDAAYSDPMGLGASRDEEIPDPEADQNRDLLTDPTLYDDSWG